MKFTAVLLLAGSLHVCATGNSQTVTISVKNVPIKKVFKEIIRQTGVSFIYNEKLFDHFSRLSINVKEASVEEVLRQCFINQPFKFKIENNVISITKENPSPPPVRSSSLASEPTPVEIQGKISNENGAPLSNVSIVIKGTQTGVTTDVNGDFRITAPDEKTVLVISYVGFQTQEIVVGRKNNLNIRLVAADNKMNDVVVVGYGSQNRRNVTGAISKVNESEFKTAIVTTVEQALQGRATGVQVTETSGEPGADIVVRIRGINSLSGTNQPLYVIDGFPMPPYTEASGPSAAFGIYASNGLYGLNPNDIESLEVLKDASATAIYGSRAANGVVLITTKKGRIGKSEIEIVNKTSFSKISNPYKMMNGREFASLMNEVAAQNPVPQPAPFNLDTISKLPNTNWLDVVSHTGLRQENGINYRGGSGNTNYFLSGTYLLDKGLLKFSDNKRGSIRFNLNSGLKPWYDVRVQLNATSERLTRAITESRGWGSGASQAGAVMDALRASPLHDTKYIAGGLAVNQVGGLILSTGAWANPLQELSDKTDFTYNNQLGANIENIFYLDKDKNLELHYVAGASLQLSERDIMLPPWLGAAASYNGIVSQASAKTQSYNSSLYLNYKFKKGSHSLVTTAGAEYNNVILTTNSAQGTDFDFSSIALYDMASAKNQSISSYKEEGVIQSGFIRENYSFSDKYVLSASFRADGSSKFAQNKKWGYFPSIAAAWNLDKEKFMGGIKSLDFARIRASYGLTGNQSLPAYRSEASYATTSYELGNTSGGTNTFLGLYPTQPNNPDLKWETTKQLDIGAEASFSSNKLSFTVDYYNKLTIDLLQNLPVPSESGYATLWANNGSIRNRGIEASVGLIPFQTKSFTWSTRLNFSRNRTTVVSLGKFDPTTQGYGSIGGNIYGNGNQTILLPGQDLGLFYGYKVIGLYQQSDIDGTGHFKVPVPVNTNDNFLGRPKFYDKDGNGLIDQNDKLVIGHAQPKFILSWNNNLSWKNWSLNLFFNGSFGNDIYDMTNNYLATGIPVLGGGLVDFNQTEDWYKKRWTTSNPTNDPHYPALHPLSYTNLPNSYTNDPISTYIENGTYVRLKSLTLSYAPRIHSKAITGLNIYATATNVLTITKYRGFDPEVSSLGSDVRFQGIDYGAYPKARSYTLGFTVNF